MNNDSVLEVLSPLAPLARPGGEVAGGQAPTGSPVDLKGKRVAFISFTGFRREQLFEILQSELPAMFDGLELLSYEEFGDIHGPDEPAVIAALPQRLTDLEVDAAIVGTGA